MEPTDEDRLKMIIIFNSVTTEADRTQLALMGLAVTCAMGDPDSKAIFNKLKDALLKANVPSAMELIKKVENYTPL